jgi:uncharacterized membrane protein
MEFEQTVTIQRPLEEVYAYMSDAEHEAEWRTNVIEMTHVSGPRTGAGATYRQVVKGPFGRGLPADMRFTEAEPNERLAFETLTGPMRPNGEITFSPAGEGQTKLHIRMTWEPTGAMKLVAPLLGPMFSRSLREGYSNLVRILDTPPSPASTSS